jgi:hypothetical protein
MSPLKLLEDAFHGLKVKKIGQNELHMEFKNITVTIVDTDGEVEAYYEDPPVDGYIIGDEHIISKHIWKKNFAKRNHAISETISDVIYWYVKTYLSNFA